MRIYDVRNLTAAPNPQPPVLHPYQAEGGLSITWGDHKTNAIVWT